MKKDKRRISLDLRDPVQYELYQACVRARENFRPEAEVLDAPHVAQLQALETLKARAKQMEHEKAWQVRKERDLPRMPGRGFRDINDIEPIQAWAPAQGQAQAFPNLDALAQEIGLRRVGRQDFHFDNRDAVRIEAMPMEVDQEAANWGINDAFLNRPPGTPEPGNG